MCAVLESAVLRESDQLMENLHFPAVDSVRGSSWINSHVTLPRNSALQLMRAQHGGHTSSQAPCTYEMVSRWRSGRAMDFLAVMGSIPGTGVGHLGQLSLPSLRAR